MQKAAKAMYIVGLVLAICLIVTGVILTIIGPIEIAAGVINDNKAKVEEGGSTLGRGIWLMTSNIVALIFTIIGYRAFLRSENKVAPYVLAIIGGVIATAFSAVGGILSLILFCRNTEEKAEEAPANDNHADAIDAEVVEEPKEN